jgi:pimeloyl-ACP methyl ester carboxylesterase
VSRWLKITLGVIAGLIVLLLINAVVTSNETKSAHVRNEGAQLVETSNGALQVLDEGDKNGSPIVLIHCYTCSMFWWDKLAPLLERDHRVVRVDLLGHGGSDKPGGGYSIEDQARAVAQALAKVGVVNATVVGHSLGGTVATALAEQSPELASRLVIIDQAPDNSTLDQSLTEKAGRWPVIGPALQRLVNLAPTTLVRDQYDIAFAPGFNFASGFENPDQPVDDLRAMTYTAYKESSDAESDYVDERPLDQRLASSHVPLLVIFGTEDQIYDAQEAVDRYSAVPGAQTHLIPGAGHSPNVEKPGEVAPLILAFAQAPPPAPKPTKQPAKKQPRPKKQAAKKQPQKQQPAGKK